MRLTVFSIFDSAAAAYTRPFYCAADAQAVRMFSDLVANKETEVGKHPEDYALVRIGIFDDANAKLDAEKVLTLVTGLEIAARAQNAIHEKVRKVEAANGGMPSESMVEVAAKALQEMTGRPFDEGDES